MNAQGVSATQVAADITKYGGVLVAVLTVLGNAVPGLGVPGGVQAILDAVIAVVTAVMSIKSQKAVATAKAGS
jgi:hypothetical protein